MNSPKRILTACGLAALLGNAACANEFSTERVYDRKETCLTDDMPDEQGRCTFGEEVYWILEGEVADSSRSSEGRLLALRARRLPVVYALNGLFPVTRLRLTQDLLVAMLPMYDDDTLPRVTRLAANTLARARGDDPLLRAMVVLDFRTGYSPLLETSAVQYLLAYPYLELHGRDLLTYLLNHDGRDASGALIAEPDDMVPVLRAIADMLEDYTPSTLPRRNSVKLAELLLTEDNRMNDPLVNAPTLWGVRLDTRGLPRPTTTTSGNLRGPYVDANNDGLADVDSLGRLVDDTRSPVYIRPFGDGDGYDDLGRALDPGSGELLYEHLNIGHTVLYAALQEGQAVMAATPEVTAGIAEPHGLITVLPDILENLAGQRDLPGADGLRHYVIDSQDEELLNVLYAVGRTADFPEFMDLAWTMTEIARNEGQTAPLLRTMRESLDKTDGITGELAPNNTLVDDLMPILAQIAAVPGLLEDVLVAFTDQEIERLSTAMVLMMRYKRRNYNPAAPGWMAHEFRVTETEMFQCLDDPMLPPNAADNACDAEPTVGCCLFYNRVFHTSSEADYNVSYMQRLMKLFQDGSGQKYCPLSGSGVGCITYQIDDLAAYHLDALAGTCRPENEMPQLVVDIIRDLHHADGILPNLDEDAHSDHPEINMTACPTIYALNHFVNYNHAGLGNVVDPWGHDYDKALAMGLPVEDREQYLIRNYHGDTLFAAEVAGFGEVLKVLLRPFSLHDCPYYDTTGTLVNRSCTHLAAKMTAVLAKHYPSAGSDVNQNTNADAPGYATFTDVRSMEPALIAMVENGELVRRFRATLIAAMALSAPGDTDFTVAVAQLLRHLLTFDSSIKYRDGTNVTTSGDGYAISPVNRAYVLMDAIEGLVDHMDADPDASRALELWWDHADEQLLPTTGNDVNTTFVNRRVPVLVDHGLAYLYQELATKQAAGTLGAYWNSGLTTDVQDLIGGDMVSVAMAMKDNLQYRTELQDELWTLGDYLLGSGSDLKPTALLLTEWIQRLQDEQTMDPLLGFAASLIRPGADPTTIAAMHLLDRTLKLPESDIVVPATRDALHIGPYGQSPAGTMWDLLTELNRLSPGIETALEPHDMSLILEELENYLRDEDHGIEKLYQLIAHREPEAEE